MAGTASWIALVFHRYHNLVGDEKVVNDVIHTHEKKAVRSGVVIFYKCVL
jgi:succinate dehydrogenase hydrophobic anchor subunit